MKKNNLMMVIKAICKLAMPVASLKADGVLIIQSMVTLQTGITGMKVGSILVDEGYVRLCESHTLSSREWE